MHHYPQTREAISSWIGWGLRQLSNGQRISPRKSPQPFQAFSLLNNCTTATAPLLMFEDLVKLLGTIFYAHTLGTKWNLPVLDVNLLVGCCLLVMMMILFWSCVRSAYSPCDFCTWDLQCQAYNKAIFPGGCSSLFAFVVTNDPWVIDMCHFGFITFTSSLTLP